MRVYLLQGCGASSTPNFYFDPLDRSAVVGTFAQRETKHSSTHGDFLPHDSTAEQVFLYACLACLPIVPPQSQVTVTVGDDAEPCRPTESFSSLGGDDHRGISLDKIAVFAGACTTVQALLTQRYQHNFAVLASRPGGSSGASGRRIRVSGIERFDREYICRPQQIRQPVVLRHSFRCRPGI